jgi:hypothetical protein
MTRKDSTSRVDSMFSLDCSYLPRSDNFDLRKVFESAGSDS